jgi:hypothetical protein
LPLAGEHTQFPEMKKAQKHGNRGPTVKGEISKKCRWASEAIRQVLSHMFRIGTGAGGCRAEMDNVLNQVIFVN